MTYIIRRIEIGMFTFAGFTVYDRDENILSMGTYGTVTDAERMARVIIALAETLNVF
jgi:hypothetical protein